MIGKCNTRMSWLPQGIRMALGLAVPSIGVYLFFLLARQNEAQNRAAERVRRVTTDLCSPFAGGASPQGSVTAHEELETIPRETVVRRKVWNISCTAGTWQFDILMYDDTKQLRALFARNLQKSVPGPTLEKADQAQSLALKRLRELRVLLPQTHVLDIRSSLFVRELNLWRTTLWIRNPDNPTHYLVRIDLSRRGGNPLSLELLSQSSVAARQSRRQSGAPGVPSAN